MVSKGVENIVNKVKRVNKEALTVAGAKKLFI